MKTKFLFISLLIANAIFASPPSEEGKSIFSTRCSGCHNVNKIVTGPALAGVDQRRSIDWIINFVHSSQSLVKSGDKEAIALFEKFNRIPMPDHPDLTSDNIKSIVDYIKSEASSNSNKAPFATPSKFQKPYTPILITDYRFFISYSLIVALLIGGLLLAVQAKSFERNVREKN